MVLSVARCAARATPRGAVRALGRPAYVQYTAWNANAAPARSYADKKRGGKPVRAMRENADFRRFLEDQGFISAVFEPPRPSSTVSAQVLRRARLPGAKAKALAQASKALRQQVAQEAAPAASPASSDPWNDTGSPSSSSFSVRRTPSSDVSEVVALATAQSYNFDALLGSGCLPDTWRWLEDREVIYIPSWPAQRAGLAPVPGSGSVFVFRSGCYVTWGMDPAHHKAFAEQVIRGGAAPVENEPFKVAGDEAMEYVYLPNETTRVVGDLVVVGQPPPGSTPGLSLARTGGQDAQLPTTFTMQSRLAFSQGLAASARLSVQEAVLSEYLASVSPIPAQLEAEGKTPLGRRGVIRKLGTLLVLRQRINLDRDNFIDDPEMYWENSQMEGRSAS